MVFGTVGLALAVLGGYLEVYANRFGWGFLSFFTMLWHMVDVSNSLRSQFAFIFERTKNDCLNFFLYIMCASLLFHHRLFFAVVIVI